MIGFFFLFADNYIQVVSRLVLRDLESISSAPTRCMGRTMTA